MLERMMSRSKEKDEIGVETVLRRLAFNAYMFGTSKGFVVDT